MSWPGMLWSAVLQRLPAFNGCMPWSIIIFAWDLHSGDLSRDMLGHDVACMHVLPRSLKGLFCDKPTVHRKAVDFSIHLLCLHSYSTGSSNRHLFSTRVHSIKINSSARILGHFCTQSSFLCISSLSILSPWLPVTLL
jgi:hypothetical protein